MRYSMIVIAVLALLVLSCGLIRKEPVAAMPVEDGKQAQAAARAANDEPRATAPETPAMPVSTAVNLTSTMIRSQEETNRDYGYAFDRGTAARIESGEVRPRTARPGMHVQLILTYVILTHAKAATDVRETREIWFNDRMRERIEMEIARTGGTYRSAVPFRLPANAERGTYKVVYIVQTPHSRDLREAAFVVGAARPGHGR